MLAARLVETRADRGPGVILHERIRANQRATGQGVAAAIGQRDRLCIIGSSALIELASIKPNARAEQRPTREIIDPIKNLVLGTDIGARRDDALGIRMNAARLSE